MAEGRQNYKQEKFSMLNMRTLKGLVKLHFAIKSSLERVKKKARKRGWEGERS